jgi:hypothetical protein
MIDEETPPNCGSGVDVDICYEPSQPREHARWKAQIPLPEPICKTIKDDRVHTRIGENDLKRMPGCWIARLYAPDIFAQQRPNPDASLCVTCLLESLRG